ncbi:hypothetical protein [Roseiconus lacunae]|uniref:DUF3325 domain-containing protein n=1 Tax=Roseiconus lacunae TaxID=2605694 RepID=A0ABT7PLM3_9BACT|nr:hypothetical protein [Roseiconus lacunae]MCD0460844.1 hypothetical protein [Roseiconus lacunae]MDM4017402.1 hypothetical protein [Roseiconus lacunae]WRQ48688.1 hypothetical protein U8335_17165 [Stieleria sp. HD01]
MFGGGLLLGGTLLFFAIWLQWTEHHGWPHDHFDSDDDLEYRKQRKRSRSKVNSLIGICGMLVLAATLVNDRLIFVAAWTAVTFILLVIIVLAMLDAFRTHRYHQDKMRRIREQALKD